MTDELVDIIDENNNVVGKELKTIVHKKGLRHRVSAVLLQREDDRFLIPTASEQKVEAGKLYHSAAGHTRSGETYQESAIRELFEESGIKVDEVEYIGTFWFKRIYSTRE